MKKIMSVLMILVTVFALMVPAFADNATGLGIDMWVNCADGYRLNVREQPDINAKQITRFDCGTKVRVLADAGNGWVYVTNEKVTGYVMRKFLQDSKPGKYEITERDDHFVAVTPYTVFAKALNAKTGNSVGLRVKPNKTSQAIRRLAAGDSLQVIARGKVWSKVMDPLTGKTGYVANDYTTLF